jgi:hypothetical protein
MPDSYTGTPIITLIGPGKSIDLNGLDNIRVNRNRVTLREGADAMFGSALSISNFEVTRLPGQNYWDGYLSGTGFDRKKDRVFVNGVEVINPTFKSASRYDINFRVPRDENLTVMVVRDKQVVSKSFPNPAVVKVTGTTVVGFTPAVNTKKVKRPSVLLLKLNGEGFTPALDPFSSRGTGGILSVSPTEVIVEVRNAELPVVVTLRDRDTGIMASGVAPKEEPKEPPKDKETKPPDKPKTEPEAKPKAEAEQKPPKRKKE